MTSMAPPGMGPKGAGGAPGLMAQRQMPRGPMPPQGGMNNPAARGQLQAMLAARAQQRPVGPAGAQPVNGVRPIGPGMMPRMPFTGAPGPLAAAAQGQSQALLQQIARRGR